MRKYTIVGTGGTGGAIGSYLAKAGKDVTFIARGNNLKAMNESGLKVIRQQDDHNTDFKYIRHGRRIAGAFSRHSCYGRLHICGCSDQRTRMHTDERGYSESDLRNS